MYQFPAGRRHVELAERVGGRVLLLLRLVRVQEHQLRAGRGVIWSFSTTSPRTDTTLLRLTVFSGRSLAVPGSGKRARLDRHVRRRDHGVRTAPARRQHARRVLADLLDRRAARRSAGGRREEARPAGGHGGGHGG